MHMLFFLKQMKTGLSSSKKKSLMHHSLPSCLYALFCNVMLVALDIHSVMSVYVTVPVMFCFAVSE